MVIQKLDFVINVDTGTFSFSFSSSVFLYHRTLKLNFTFLFFPFFCSRKKPACGNVCGWGPGGNNCCMACTCNSYGSPCTYGCANACDDIHRGGALRLEDNSRTILINIVFESNTAFGKEHHFNAITKYSHFKNNILFPASTLDYHIWYKNVPLRLGTRQG